MLSILQMLTLWIQDHITKIAAIETATVIGEYDPSVPDNHVLNGLLDIIAAIQTLAIKVCNIIASLS